MNKTVVVNILHHSPFDRYIGRAGKGHDGYFGNPFPLRAGHQRGSTIAIFRAYFYDRIARDKEFKRNVLQLRGKRLGCFCKPSACHGDVYADYLNSMSDAQWLEELQLLDEM